MRRKASVAGIALVAFAATVAGAWLTFARGEGPWPPEWYVEPARNHDEYLARWKRLRRRAVARSDIDFPPSDAKLDLLRLQAVGASSQPGDTRPADARVYFSSQGFVDQVLNGGQPTISIGASVYVLALRGKFSTARVRRPPGITRPMPPFAPMVVIAVDAATMDTKSAYLGRVRDLSPLGESILLDLDEEPT